MSSDDNLLIVLAAGIALAAGVAIGWWIYSSGFQAPGQTQLQNQETISWTGRRGKEYVIKIDRTVHT